MEKYLLSDEIKILEDDYNERKNLIEKFQKMPEDFFSKLRHFQPQVGCLNACSICSKCANCNSEYWENNRLRNIIAALKYSSPSKQSPYIVWNRDNHRSGVVFPYLDNDVGFYEHLDNFIKLSYDELGVKTRISTVGFSRYNSKLNKMHENISGNFEALAGFRLSFTPYEIGWVKDNFDFSRDNYIKDMANILRIYKKYYDYIGSGSRNFCIELRYKPFITLGNVYTFTYKGKFIIYSKKHLYMSKNTNIEFLDTKIEDPFDHRLKLSNDGICFNKIELDKDFENVEEIKKYIDNGYNIEKEVRVYRVRNKDGEYYSIDPQLTDNGNYGIYIYPTTKTRKKSGCMITERFLINSINEYKESRKNINEENKEWKWNDVHKIIINLKNYALECKKNGDIEKYNYLNNSFIPMIIGYVKALYIAGFNPSVFFDKKFTIDTGTICNLGRALSEFKGLVSFENEPLTLNHERNYGRINSTMTKEGVAWRLSCEYNDRILIEKLDLSETATQEGQTQKCYYINNMTDKNKKINLKTLKYENLIPGQRNLEWQ